MKSPLRWPGGKIRAIKLLKKYIPDNTKIICSPFIGWQMLNLQKI